MGLNREAMASYIDTTFSKSASNTESAKWELLGTDIEEMTVELNPDTETLKNILGQTRTKDNGYEASMDADPFYADPDSDLYKRVRDIALGRLKGDECRTLLLEIIVEDASATKHLAYVREVMLKPQSYGGDTAGLNFPFSVSENGESVKGSVTAASIKAGAPVFTAGDELSD